MAVEDRLPVASMGPILQALPRLDSTICIHPRSTVREDNTMPPVEHGPSTILPP